MITGAHSIIYSKSPEADRVFLNVGRHRRFRPAVFARELAPFDVVDVGAAGTFVVRPA
jgi:hypothetical protein